MCVELLKSEVASKERLKVSQLEATATRLGRSKDSALCARNVLCARDVKVRSKSATRVPDQGLSASALKSSHEPTGEDEEKFLTSREVGAKMRAIKAENASRVEAWVLDCSPENTDHPRVVTG